MANVDSQVIEKFLYQDEPSPVIGRETIWTNDDNSSAYNGQIVFNLSSLGQTQKWLSYQEAYIQVPYVVSMKSNNVDITTKVNSKIVSPKDFFGQIIDSISVEVNGRTVHQQQSFNNVHSYFKFLTSADYSYLVKNSSSSGIYFDTNDEKNKTTAASSLAPAGVYVNNASNSVILRNSEIISTGNTKSLDTSSLTSVINSGGSFYTAEGTAENRIYYWVIMSLIKLSDITDFFNKLPICKTTDIRLLLNYNSTTVNITLDAAGTITASSVIQTSSNTCPYTIQMATPIDVATSLTFHSGVMKTTHGTPGLALNACRLYVPVYEIDPATALNMIKLKPTTTVNYNDVYTFQITNKAAKTDVVETISTGIVNAKYIWVLPFPSPISPNTLPEWQNPYDTAPATTSNIILDSFQVQLAGRNVFRADVKYDYNMFMDELSKINALEGNNNNSMTSGLIRQYQFQNSHRIYVADLSRHNQSDSLISKSIVVSFKNAGAVPVSCLVFVAYGRSVALDTATGISNDMIIAK
jgi:hypothetical protein